MNCFDDPKPSFISVQNETFIIDRQAHQTIQCMIQKVQPVRKLFQDRKLKCYSMDAKTSHNHKIYCCFCDHKHICQRKIRLSMVMLIAPEPIPVVLDINPPSFQGLKTLIDQIGEEKLKDSPVNLKLIYDEQDRRLIEFSA